MEKALSVKYFLVEAKILPEIFIKVVEAKQLLERGEASTVADATARLGISRSAYYKYKDSISPFQDLKRTKIISLQVAMRNRMGVLSSLLTAFANTGADILTINQGIPMNETALVTISADTSDMNITAEELMVTLRNLPDIKKVGFSAG